jgi:hypothetical protein
MLRNQFKKMLKQSLEYGVALFVCFTFVLAGCGGRAANPVMVSQFGDQRKSCEALQVEMSQNQQEISRLLPDTNKDGANAFLGVAGLFLLVPWFFMDFSESEQIEVNAYRQRYNHLALVAMDKKCGYDTKPIPAFTKPEEKKEKKDVFTIDEDY